MVFFSDPGLLPFPSTMELSNYEKIEDIYIRLHETYHGKHVGYGMMLSILCQELVHEVCRECFFPKDHKLNLKRLDKAIEYIEKKFMNTIRIEELCQCVNLNESNMIKLFKNNLGRTPVDYINQVRINKAKELLLHTNGTIKEIAFQTGFSDEFYFSRVFKKMEGKSPRGFRQQLLS
jgi:AraC family transcriptional regulator, transcriptional activator for feuABC-ybbA operon